MEQPQSEQPQPTPVSSKKFSWRNLILILLALIITAGVGISIAWKTDYLDNWLPLSIKKMFWKTFENESFGISFKYPKTYQLTKEQGIETGKFGGEFILTDQSRSGNPQLLAYFNFYGGFAGWELGCVNEIDYEIAVKDGKVEVLSREFDPLTEELLDFCLEEGFWIKEEFYRVWLTIGQPPEPYPEYEEGIKDNNWILVRFEYEGTDYESELRQIIETIRITKEEIYGK